MTPSKLTRNRIAQAFLFLVFFACSPPSQWISEEIDARESEQRAERLAYLPDDSMAKMHVQVLTGDYGIRFALHLLSRKAPPGTTYISVNGKRADVELMDGGQVLLLNDGEYWLDQLRSGRSLTIVLPGYRTVIPPIDTT